MREEAATYDWLFGAFSALTDHFPRGGARILDTVVGLSAGSRLTLARGMAAARASLGRVRAFRRILVVADLNIGDAVMLQSVISALRNFLPDAEIDYAVSRLAGPIVGDSESTTVHPILGATAAPGLRDARAVRRLAEARRPDVLFNFCPFFDERSLAPAGTPVVGWIALGALTLRCARQPATVGHVAAVSHRLVHDLLEPLLPARGSRPFEGVSLALSLEAAERAAAFAHSARDGRLPLVLLNPDASSRFTRPPLALQTALLRGLVRLPCTPVLGAGHTAPGIETQVLAGLTPAERARVRVLPASMPLDGYAAIVDAAAVYLSGDTGPLHVAAARKRRRDGGGRFRNRTTVISLFGATPARLYGYASGRPGFLAANQSAPSFVHAGASACRNLTCIHKTAKTCATVRCFERLQAAAVLADVERALRAAGARAAPAPARAPEPA